MDHFHRARVLSIIAFGFAFPSLASAQTSANGSQPPNPAPAMAAPPGPAAAASETSVAPPWAPTATAESTTPAAPPSVAPRAPTVLQRARVSLPWHMRPASVASLLRIDGDIAVTTGGTTEATVLTGGYAVVPNFGVFARWAMVNNAPRMGTAGTALSNPIVFALFAPEILPHVRLSLFLGATIPVGMGGGNQPDAPTRAAVGAGIYARSAMDNALFAVNYFTPTAGVGLGYMDHGFTVLAEATVLQLIRVRGEALDSDEMRTNFTSGLHVGYTFAKYITASVEVHYQRWLSTPAAVALNPALRDLATGQFGVRTNIPVSAKILMRPGIAFSVPFNGFLGPYQGWAFQFDLPVAFF